MGAIAVIRLSGEGCIALVERIYKSLSGKQLQEAAARWETAEEEAIKSATASAWDKSIFPFKKARCVNSPGVANRAPVSTNNFNNRC